MAALPGRAKGAAKDILRTDTSTPKNLSAATTEYNL